MGISYMFNICSFLWKLYKLGACVCVRVCAPKYLMMIRGAEEMCTEMDVDGKFLAVRFCGGILAYATNKTLCIPFIKLCVLLLLTT